MKYKSWLPGLVWNNSRISRSVSSPTRIVFWLLTDSTAFFTMRRSASPFGGLVWLWARLRLSNSRKHCLFLALAKNTSFFIGTLASSVNVTVAPTLPLDLLCCVICFVYMLSWYPSNTMIWPPIILGDVIRVQTKNLLESRISERGPDYSV